MIELHHSSCHGMMREGALVDTKLNLEYGGEQRTLRDSVMTTDCLGTLPAVMVVDGETTDCKLKVGDVQRGYFTESDPPPFLPLSKSDQKLLGQPYAPKTVIRSRERQKI